MTLLVILFVVPAVLALVFAVWILLRFAWWKGFFIGVFGLGLLLGAFLLGLATLTLSHYQLASGSTFLGTITVRDEAPQQYVVTVAQERLAESYDLEGDLWRAVAVQYDVPRWLVAGETLPVVQLTRIEARFLLMEDELAAQRQAPGVAWFIRLGEWMLGQMFVRQEHYTPLLPLTVQAIFSLDWQGDRLVLRGVNEPAEEALRR